MCLAVPGKIVKIDKNSATVDYGSDQRTGQLVEKGYAVGDYVIIQGGIVAMKIEKKEAEEALRLYKEAVTE